MLVPFPLVLLSASVVFDVGLLADNGRRSEIAFWVIAAGVRCGLAAKVFGVVGFAHATAPVPTPSAWGLLLSVSVGEPFTASWLPRMDAPGEPSAIAIILSLPGVGLAGMTGRFGGESVERLGVGGTRGAHFNAPSSLSGRPASEGSTKSEGSTNKRRGK